MHPDINYEELNWRLTKSEKIVCAKFRTETCVTTPPNVMLTKFKNGVWFFSPITKSLHLFEHIVRHISTANVITMIIKTHNHTNVSNGSNNFSSSENVVPCGFMNTTDVWAYGNDAVYCFDRSTRHLSAFHNFLLHRPNTNNWLKIQWFRKLTIQIFLYTTGHIWSIVQLM